MSLPPPQLDPSWQEVLTEEWSKPYLARLATFLGQERAGQKPVYPPSREVFNAFNLTPFKKVQVLIMGQDPYHGAGQAHGLSFSVRPKVPFPPSLQNIFKELAADLKLPTPPHGCLESWAKQGVMMLNATLTVRAQEPRSHYGQGWETFTDAVVARLAERQDPVIFVLWGKSAKEKCGHILGRSEKRHFILTAPHPSPFSAHSGFFGCGHFSKINELLTRQGKAPIEWGIQA